MNRPLLYRILTWALPRSVKRRLGTELSLFWEAQARETRYRGLLGSFRLGLALIVDTFSLALRHAGSGPEALRAIARTQPTSSPREQMSKLLFHDLRYAFRTLGSSKLHSAVVIVTLALGIGATGAAFSVVEKVVLRPLPYPQPQQLVQVLRTMEEGKTRSLSWPDFRDYRDQAADYISLTAY